MIFSVIAYKHEYRRRAWTAGDVELVVRTRACQTLRGVDVHDAAEGLTVWLTGAEALKARLVHFSFYVSTASFRDNDGLWTERWRVIGRLWHMSLSGDIHYSNTHPWAYSMKLQSYFATRHHLEDVSESRVWACDVILAKAPLWV